MFVLARKINGVGLALTRLSYVVIGFVIILAQLGFVPQLLPKVAAASDVMRSTTYEFQTGEFTGTSYTLTLNNDLSTDYFTMISGASEATASRAANEDRVRVSADPHGNFGSSTSANQIELTRGSAGNNWIGAITVVECLSNCSDSGFVLDEVLETSLPSAATATLQTTVETLGSNYDTNTVPFGGRFGGGMSTSSSDANNYSTTVGVKLTKQNSNEIRFDRYGGETRVPDTATIVTYIVTWGSEWSVQDTNVTGTASGQGVDATGEYDTASISTVTRSQSWVWGGGYNYDDGLGDGALGQVIALGDGVNQNTTESVVAVGSEGGLVSPGRDFQVYVMSHADLAVDHVFRIRGDTGSGTGFQELDIGVDSALGSEAYDNLSTDVQYTEGDRVPLFYNTSAGTGQAYSRTGAWGLRLDAAANLNYWRAYAGQAVSGWVQVADFGNFSFSNVETRQQTYRWRDDSTDVNASGGWLAAENSDIADQSKGANLRLRFRVANHGTTPEDAARQYELEYAQKTGLLDCSAATTWVGVEDSAADAFELYNSANISPDGELLTGGLLGNGDGFSFVTGEAREVADTTGAIGPLNNGAYTELEYALRPTDEAVTGYQYCFRLYDQAAASELETYSVYPQLTIASTATVGTGLGEAGTFSSPANGGWQTVTFAGSYTSPVVVGTTNSHNGQSALVFESRNVTSTGAEMRVCESEGATSNGCDTHSSETVGYMVIDAAVAATIDGIEAGTFTASGTSDANSVATSYSESFGSSPYVFANVNTVNSTEFPIEVVISATSAAGFTAGICDHLQGSADACDGSHGSETVGWVAIEPGNEPFAEQFQMGVENIGASTWTGVTFSPSFASNPVVIVSSQTDTGGQDVEIDEARSVTTTGADIRYCEIDTLDVCDSHNPDDVAWLAIESGQFSNSVYLDQDGFRFYENTNSATPTVALDTENTAITSVDSGDQIHLRIANQAGGNGLSASSLITKLQYAQSSDCSVAGSWNDVGALGSGAIWRGYNNASPSDGSTLPSSLLDGGANTLQSYEEANNSTLNPNLVSAGGRSEWGWVIENNGASNFTSYCFRMVTDSGATFNYTRYPQLTTSSGVVNLSPNSPTSLGQEKLSTTAITTAEVINETDIVFTADASDQNANDFVELCVEVQELGVAFTNSETDCGTPVTYSGSAVVVTVQTNGYEHGKSYHWQARIRDAGGLYSGWVSYGGNSETEADFTIDTQAPAANIFDGTTTGVDIEFNNGELDELSANWEQVDGVAPNGVSGLVLWLDGSDVDANGTDPGDGDPISTWSDKSGLGNDISGTGDATFSDAEQAVAFSDDVQPFNDTFDRSGGNSNSHSIFSVVQGNANAATNHVWFETQSPRVSPAEDGMLGGGTSLSNNNAWSAHIIDKKMLTVDYNSGGTSTAWLERRQEHQFSETQVFADTQPLYIGDDSTGGNRLETGEFIHEIVIFNQDVSQSDREGLWEYMECKWQVKDCSVTYEYSVGTSPGGTDTIGWTGIGAGTSVTASGLSLQTSEVYFFNLRITDIAGNQTIVSTDGQQVAPSITFAASPANVTFDNLNPTNSYTDTKATVLTTSTNARSGYTIRAFMSANLSNGSQTIGGFNGGTYASPDAWQGGDTGYGYTSNDTLIEGSNIFSPATCAGGGAPPCYAPFSLSAPGDVVADNPGPVVGTPITDENFIITHRVTTDIFQDPGTYTSDVNYVINAVY